MREAREHLNKTLQCRGTRARVELLQYAVDERERASDSAGPGGETRRGRAGPGGEARRGGAEEGLALI